MRRVIALVACVAAVGFGTLAAGASAVAQTAPEAASDIPEYKLGSGDKVRVTTFGEQNLTGEFQVSGTGKIALPLVGEIDALAQPWLPSTPADDEHTLTVVPAARLRTYT